MCGSSGGSRQDLTTFPQSTVWGVWRFTEGEALASQARPMHQKRGTGYHCRRQLRGSVTSYSEEHSPCLRVRTKRMLPAICFDNFQKSHRAKSCLASSWGLPDPTDGNRHNLSALDGEVAKTKSEAAAPASLPECWQTPKPSCSPTPPPPTHTVPSATQMAWDKEQARP